MAKRNTNGNGASGDGSTIWEKMRAMRKEGVEQTIPATGRVLRLRTVEPYQLLKEGNIPDILTSLVVKGVYEDLSDEELRRFLAATRERVEDAIAYMESLDLIARKAIADDTDISDLSVAEKRWIFRLVLAPAELLATFRYEPGAVVEPVDEGENVQPSAE